MRFEANSEQAARARSILDSKIQSGIASARATIERLERDVPTDQIVKGSSVRFVPAMQTEEGADIIVPRVKMIIGENQMEIGKHAFGQVASRAGVPAGYLGDLAAAGGWQTILAAHILGQHYGAGNGTRYISRSVRGVVRGWLSDSYRRLDARPLCETACEEFARAGAVPVDGVCTETRVALKAMLPTVFEPIPGELIALGLEWSNSDYGHSKHSLRYFLLRVACLNGATMEDLISQIHLGGRLPDNLRLSEETYIADTKASRLALRDTVRAYLEPAKIEGTLEGLRLANEHKVEWRQVQNRVGRRLLKSELEAARSAFEGADTINLPAGNTAWRASNALSWIAGHTEDASRRLELERLAGEVINGKNDDVAQEALAA